MLVALASTVHADSYMLPKFDSDPVVQLALKFPQITPEEMKKVYAVVEKDASGKLAEQLQDFMLKVVKRKERERYPHFHSKKDAESMLEEFVERVGHPETGVLGKRAREEFEHEFVE